MQSTDKNERVCAPPTVEDMRPQTRHYAPADLVYDKFQQFFATYDECMRFIRKSPGCELFSRKYYIPGSQFLGDPYQLKDAAALCKVAFRPAWLQYCFMPATVVEYLCSRLPMEGGTRIFATGVGEMWLYLGVSDLLS